MNGKMFRTEEFGTASWKEMTMWVGSSSLEEAQRTNQSYMVSYFWPPRPTRNISTNINMSTNINCQI